MPRKINSSTINFLIVFLTFSLRAVGGRLEMAEELPLVVRLLLDDLNKIIEKVNATDRSKVTYLVSPSEVDWLLRAVSMKEREKWAKDFFKPGAEGKKEFYQKLDALSTSCARNIPTFIPDPSNFISHNDAYEAAMKKALPDITKTKVHQIGFAQQEWDIQEDNQHVPLKRSMIGYIWGKNSADDFSYCRLYQIKITQDYVSGGKYGESKALFLESWLVGCK